MEAVARRILFVDDERSVLDGLRRMLRPFRDEWSVFTADTGEQALDMLKKADIDVVVSDMRMPRMDGAQLLRHVADQYPDTIRMVLTGHSSNEAFLRSVGPTHQVLTKPCPPDVLIDTLRRAVLLRSRLNSPNLRKLVSEIDKLPSLPALYIKVVDALGRDASVHEIGELVAKDLAMSARILQLVNSAYFGLRNPIGNPVQAASFLGIDLIRALTLSSHAFTELKKAQRAGLDLPRLQDHSHAVANFARHIIADMGEDSIPRDLTYMAGLLHDMGLLVLGSSEPTEMGKILQAAKAGNCDVRELELEAFGATHAEVGGYLLALWGLPDDVVEAVTLHHDLDILAEREFSVAGALHLADRMVGIIAPSPMTLLDSHDSVDVEEVAERLGVGGNLTRWMAHLKASHKNAD